ncbi:alpha/beta hydrolase [Mucilaginibacter sp. BJC16-A38]|uniref:alpha/beta hydrolase n=1 Tax=Mucilaginibacter phenanthrenivorans TaxID=1234842 RepID=UPI0021580510|nr:alpha/beta hydrolase [Mucilaginibacter phenanthrenivorans]MCR8560828.1 alpha/beta hydrolase [Mucilaginibacter phenanthrenivorans]
MRTVSALMTLLIMTIFGYSQAQSPILLYPNGVQNAKPTPKSYVEKDDKGWASFVSIPTITPYFPAKGTANGTSIIIFPGGGYSGLSMDNEGSSIANAFSSFGVTAFVVKYRLPSDSIMVDKTIGPLQDAQQAVLMVRKNAAKWGLKTDKIGIIGFSAGGHLASTEGTHFDQVVIENKDNISVRPDFMLLLYPVISFGPQAHVGSRENLIGKKPAADLVDLYSNEKQVTANTPPTFLVHAGDDTVVPVQNSLMFYESLLAAKVKAEMHLFEEGGHGFGLNNSKSKNKWIDWAKNWMEENGFCPPAP